MIRMLVQIIFALPVFVVLQTALGADFDWLEALSVGVVSSMISGVWLNSVAISWKHQ